MSQSVLELRGERSVVVSQARGECIQLREQGELSLCALHISPQKSPVIR